MRGQDVLGRCPDVSRAPALTWRRIGVALAAGAAILTAASVTIRSDSDGYRAGYEATTVLWARESLTGSGVAPQPICDELYRRSQETPLEPRYDRARFRAGCAAALAELTGD